MLRPLLRATLTVLLLISSNAWAGTVLVWGDSLSAGYGLRPEQAWPSLLAKRLGDSRSKHQVVNASISGETTAGGRARLASLLRQHEPGILILELGGNDALRGLALQSTQQNLEVMIKAAREAGAQVLLVGMQVPPNYGTDYANKFAGLFTSVAQAHSGTIGRHSLRSTGRSSGCGESSGG